MNGRNSTSCGFAGLLTIVFVTLKLCGVISWSWWWVLAPMWAGLAIVVALVALAFIAAVIDVLVFKRP